MSIQSLGKLLNPRRIAVVGASDQPGKVGYTLLQNMIGRSYEGVVYPVNPAREAVQGIAAWKRLSDLPHAPDLAVICTPAAGVPDLIDECGRMGVPGAMIISAGFREVGPAGKALEDQIRQVSARYRDLRIIGPNCLGLIVPEVCKMGGIGGPARDAAKAYQPGPVGVMSRSGGMTTEISSSLTQAGLGVSTAVSIGGDAIIGSTYAELMPYFEADEQTEAIVIYTEPGGRMEAQLAEWVKDNDSRLPIVAFMAGKFMDDDEMKGMSFGHAGTIVEGKEDTATEKIARLEAAGIRVVERIDEIPDAVKEKIGATT